MRGYGGGDIGVVGLGDREDVRRELRKRSVSGTRNGVGVGGRGFMGIVVGIY